MISTSARVERLRGGETKRRSEYGIYVRADRQSRDGAQLSSSHLRLHVGTTCSTYRVGTQYGIYRSTLHFRYLINTQHERRFGEKGGVKRHTTRHVTGDFGGLAVWRLGGLAARRRVDGMDKASAHALLHMTRRAFSSPPPPSSRRACALPCWLWCTALQLACYYL
jgi:hypothetical protein